MSSKCPGYVIAATLAKGNESSVLTGSRNYSMPVDGKTIYRLRYMLLLGVLAGGASLAQTTSKPSGGLPPASKRQITADFSILTYNVKGLPWPIATGRSEALGAIADRLTLLRREGRQPSIVVLQEAFTEQARAIGSRAGYAYQVHGPYVRTSPGELAGAGGSWHLGETGPSQVDSGLIVLSDFPVISAQRAEFPTGACAGFDCLAAKGVVMVTVDIPGKGPVAIAATHLNSRKASGAPFDRTHEAYRRQASFLAGFLADRRTPDVPLVLAGDFNRGQRLVRIAALDAALAQISGDSGSSDALQVVAGSGRDSRRDSEIGWIFERARDMQFVFGGSQSALAPVGAEVPFGKEAGGEMLSDHMGFTIHYRFD